MSGSRPGAVSAAAQKSTRSTGTATLRVYDPKAELWRVTWNKPVLGQQVELEGRQQGNNVVQLGVRGGRLIRWTFSGMRAESFQWRGHALEDDGDTWRLEVEIQFERLQAG